MLRAIFSTMLIGTFFTEKVDVDIQATIFSWGHCISRITRGILEETFTGVTIYASPLLHLLFDLAILMLNVVM